MLLYVLTNKILWLLRKAVVTPIDWHGSMRTSRREIHCWNDWFYVVQKESSNSNSTSSSNPCTRAPPESTMKLSAAAVLSYLKPMQWFVPSSNPFGTKQQRMLAYAIALDYFAFWEKTSKSSLIMTCSITQSRPSKQWRRKYWPMLLKLNFQLKYVFPNNNHKLITFLLLQLPNRLTWLIISGSNVLLTISELTESQVFCIFFGSRVRTLANFLLHKILELLVSSINK